MKNQEQELFQFGIARDGACFHTIEEYFLCNLVFQFGNDVNQINRSFSSKLLVVRALQEWRRRVSKWDGESYLLGLQRRIPSEREPAITLPAPSDAASKKRLISSKFITITSDKGIMSGEVYGRRGARMRYLGNGDFRCDSS